MVMLTAAATARADYREIEVKNGGMISGRVTFRGDLPDDAVERFAIANNPEACGGIYREVVRVEVKDGALRGVFVFLDSIDAGKKWPAPRDDQYLVDQKDCRFIPAAQVIRPGSITIRNSDEGVFHTVNARELIGVEGGRIVKRTVFNVAQPYGADIKQDLHPRRSPFIALRCEAHNFMLGYLMVPEHPYAVVVNDDGSYVLDNIPPGRHTLKAWHPELGLKQMELTVPARGNVEANFVFTK